MTDNDNTSQLLNSSKGNWKRMRMVINPTFTPSKLKEVNILYQ